ncbi:DDE_3 domain-containing protein [Trichonephila clavipes]|nr:DDE_3 domain-containing protein [Trichonephila clavipes]
MVCYSSLRWPCQDTPSSRRTAAPSMYSRSYTGRWWRYYALGDVFLGISGTRGCGRADHECYRVSEHHCRPVAPLHGLCFPAENGMFQQDNALCHKTKIVLEWFQEHDAEFQLMSWLPNSLDLNPIEHIWDVMGWQLSVQRLPIRNISYLRDRCLNIWHNLSPTIYQGLVVSMPRRVEAVLRTKGGPTHY